MVGRPLDRSCRILLFRDRGCSHAGESLADDEHWQGNFGLGGGLGRGAWTLTTAVTEVTVIADLATSRDLAQFEAWWSFAEGHGNGFSMLAVAVAIIAWNEYPDPHRLLPRWSAAIGAGAGLASFAGWALGVWLDVGPANLLWLLASVVMCVWLAGLGTVLARTRDVNGAGARD